MAENVGGIVWTAEVKTEQLVGAEKTITNSLNKTDQAFTKTGKASDTLNTKFTKTASGVKKGMSGIGKNAGMAGIQVQQFVGQIQGGQSALLALSQQGADLGFVLGYAGLGAAVGIAATAFSFLLPMLTTASVDVEELKKRIEELGDSTVKTVNQIRFLADENSKAADELSKDNEKIAKSIKEKEKLLAVMSLAGQGLSTGEFDSFIPKTAEENQERYASRIKETKEELKLLKVQLDTNNQEIIQLAESTQELADTDSKLKEKTNEVSEALARQIIELEKGKKAAFEYATAQQLELKAGEKIPASIQAQIDKYFELSEAKEKQDRQNKEMAASIKKFQREEESSKKKRKTDFKNLEQEIILAQMKNTLANEEFEIKSAIMALGENASDIEINRITALVQQMQQLRFEAELTGQTISEAFEGAGLRAMDSFSDATANAIVEQESLEDGIKSVAKTFLTEMLSAIIRYWVGQAAAALAGNAAVTASTVTAAGISSAAWATPAALASVATLGGAAATGTAALAGAVASGQALSQVNMGAGRLNGGPVSAGMMHPVTEDGRPELLVQGGKQFLLPGSRGGEVISNKDMAAGGGGSTSISMPITVYGDVDQQQVRNVLFDSEDAIYDLYNRAKAKRGER